MKGQTRKFRDGQIIFDEGDVSPTAFELLSGKVELTKRTVTGSLHLALLEPGEIFGEMGILDGGPRTATAIARGPVNVKSISRTNFLGALKTDPKLAAELLEKLAARLRRADEMLVQGNNPVVIADAAPAKPKPSAGGPGFWSRLLSVGKGGTRTNPIEIAVANLVGDVDGQLSKVLVDAFAGIDGLGARALGHELAPEPDGDLTAQLATLTKTGRQWLASVNADVLIWGAMTDEGRGMRLRFLSAVEDDLERPGLFVPANWLDLPATLDEHLITLLQAVSCAAVIPTDEPQRERLKHILPERLIFLKPMAKRPPTDMDRTSQAGLKVCLATANAALGYISGDHGWYELALETYRDAVKAFERSQSRLDEALAFKRLGVLTAMLAEGIDAPTQLEEAAQYLRNALDVLTVDLMPLEWAGTNLRLGNLLYRLDSKFQAEGALLGEAATSFRDSLTVYTMATTPYKWAETKNSLAQVLQILGGQQRRIELLQHAVDCGIDALKVRTRDAMPQQWAVTQNNIGSAYFLLARLANESEYLIGAEEAFRGARDVYRALGGTRQARVAERNLTRVAELAARAEVARPAAPVKFDWDDQGKDGDGAAPPSDSDAKSAAAAETGTPQRDHPRVLDDG